MSNHDAATLVKIFRSEFRWNDRLKTVPVLKTDDGCWINQRKVSSSGYVQIATNGNSAKIYWHRLAYMCAEQNAESLRPIPDGMTISHLCYNERCGNPEHLSCDTMRVNLSRAYCPNIQVVKGFAVDQCTHSKHCMKRGPSCTVPAVIE